jgi:hypothetical protein
MADRLIDLRLNDTRLGIWQDDPNDPSFRREIFLGLIAHLRGRGWIVAPDSNVLDHHQCISPNYKMARRDNMRASLETCGRSCSIEFWSTASRQSNKNGQRYDFDKFARMPYLDRNRFLLERQKVLAWLVMVSDVTATPNSNRTAHPLAADFIAARYAESWHSDKELGRPICRYKGNASSADGGIIEHGCTVWFRGRDGRWRRGQAFYNINNMWWVVENKFDVRNLPCFELYRNTPSDLREKRKDRVRRAALERELRAAMRSEDQRRSTVISRILFGDDEPHFIWSREERAYYGTNYSGYTANRIDAGRYTRAEAEAECRRVPHILEMVCPNGQRVNFEFEQLEAQNG